MKLQNQIYKEKCSKQLWLLHMGHDHEIVGRIGLGGGLVVSVLAFYSDDPCLIPAGYLICKK